MQAPIDLQQCAAVALFALLGTVLSARYWLYVNIADANMGLLVARNQFTDSSTYAAVNLRASTLASPWLADRLADMPVRCIATFDNRACHVSCCCTGRTRSDHYANVVSVVAVKC